MYSQQVLTHILMRLHYLGYWIGLIGFGLSCGVIFFTDNNLSMTIFENVLMVSLLFLFRFEWLPRWYCKLHMDDQLNAEALNQCNDLAFRLKATALKVNDLSYRIKHFEMSKLHLKKAKLELRRYQKALKQQKRFGRLLMMWFGSTAINSRLDAKLFE